MNAITLTAKDGAQCGIRAIRRNKQTLCVVIDWPCGIQSFPDVENYSDEAETPRRIESAIERAKRYGFSTKA